MVEHSAQSEAPALTQRTPGLRPCSQSLTGAAAWLRTTRRVPVGQGKVMYDLDPRAKRAQFAHVRKLRLDRREQRGFGAFPICHDHSLLCRASYSALLPNVRPSADTAQGKRPESR